MIIDYKSLKKEVRSKFKMKPRNYGWRIATNCKLHPKMPYKYINENVKTTSNIRAIKNTENEIIMDRETVCEQFNEWFLRF